jgi:ATP-dependent helicase/nuclease subunit B
MTIEPIDKTHQSPAAWAALLAQVREALARQRAHAARAVVLLPFAQLMPLARAAWVQTVGAGAEVFVPRFETTMNWASNPAPGVAAWQAGADDLRFDAALDALTAAALLTRAGLALERELLVPRLLDAAYSLAPVAAAQLPARRVAWSQGLRAALTKHGHGVLGERLALENTVTALALAWVGSSGFASDVLFSNELNEQVEILITVQGLQPEPLAQALAAHFDERCVPLNWPFELSSEAPSSLQLHTAQDAEDEAEQAAACVLRHISAGHVPVGVAALDRALTRRLRAMLARAGVRVRDETGWKLSTTRSAAMLMALLRASDAQASDDDTLNLAKLSPALPATAVDSWERSLRFESYEENRPLALVESARVAIKSIAFKLQSCCRALQKPRNLAAWLKDFSAVLDELGALAALRSDTAGQQVLQALHMGDAQDASIELTTAEFAHELISLRDFNTWVQQTLEAASFVPLPDADAQVIVLPLSQVLGRPLAALVLPGCDEDNLPAVPELPGPWTAAQRALLGLPAREAVQAAQQAAWQTALQLPRVDVLHRHSHEGRPVQASRLLQAWSLQHAPAATEDPRECVELTAQPTPVPAPRGDALPLEKLSASAYASLRACPYQFFAQRLLGLREPKELNAAIEKREFGTWLHAVLKQFHIQNKPLTVEKYAWAAMLNIASEQITQQQGYNEAEFLPFAAQWPGVRDAYVEWLEAHLQSGATFQEAESSHERAHAGLKLIGKLDRVDALADSTPLVIDYKTESAKTTKDRIDEPLEDTQLAFYAALMQQDALQATYLNLNEKPVKSYEQKNVHAARDALLQGISDDVVRIAAGEPLAPLGEGRTCDYCAARGLCRKDWWSAA